MTGKTLMVQGAMSSVGKSLLVTGLCRVFARRGIKVAPFKAQNMSNNAAVCSDGSEIGRAQYTQALACGLAATAVMNPILLKPEADARSQVIVMGKVQETLPASVYYQRKDELWTVVTGALDSLRNEYDLVVMEGAGSPAELNLKQGDIVNMAVALYARSPVLLAGDIDRGGIFAQLLGTLWLLEDEERALIRGMIVNKFRGDPDLFEEGVHILEQKSGLPVLGVVPYYEHRLPEEDAVAIEPQNSTSQSVARIDIVVIRLPRIANFDDFDPLHLEPGVSVRYVSEVGELGRPHAVIIPGTKSTIADLVWLRHKGLDKAIRDYAGQGGCVVGICGGYQMLGQRIADPDHVESDQDKVEGLGLLPVTTTFAGMKATYQVKASVCERRGWLSGVDDLLSGYEIHMGRTQGDSAPWLNIMQRGEQKTDVLDGALSDDGRIWGCYLHGIFTNAQLRYSWLRSLGWEHSHSSEYDMMTTGLDHWADVVETALDMAAIEKMLLF